MFHVKHISILTNEPGAGRMSPRRVAQRSRYRFEWDNHQRLSSEHGI
jgi:hypothetical protein